MKRSPPHPLPPKKIIYDYICDYIYAGKGKHRLIVQLVKYSKNPENNVLLNEGKQEIMELRKEAKDERKRETRQNRPTEGSSEKSFTQKMTIRTVDFFKQNRKQHMLLKHPSIIC